MSKMQSRVIANFQNILLLTFYLLFLFLNFKKLGNPCKLEEPRLNSISRRI